MSAGWLRHLVAFLLIGGLTLMLCLWSQRFDRLIAGQT